MATRVHLVLGGGAMLGIGHAGAYKALSRVPNLEIASVAGTSAGAIFGALVSSKHTAEEIEALVCQLPFESWLDPANGIGIPEVKTVTKDYKRFARRCQLWGLARTYILHRKHEQAVKDTLSGHPGLYKGVALSSWVQETLAQKLGIDPSVPVLFSHLRDKGIPLCVVATNLNAGIAHLFGTEFTPDEGVAVGVQASASLPLIFQSVKSKRGVDLVDGGLIANLPVGQISSEVLDEDFVVTVTLKTEAAVDRRVNNVLEVAWASFEAARGVQQSKPGRRKHVPVDLSLKINPLNFSPSLDEVHRNMDMAERQAKAALASLGVS